MSRRWRYVVLHASTAGLGGCRCACARVGPISHVDYVPMSPPAPASDPNPNTVTSWAERLASAIGRSAPHRSAPCIPPPTVLIGDPSSPGCYGSLSSQPESAEALDCALDSRSRTFRKVAFYLPNLNHATLTFTSERPLSDIRRRSSRSRYSSNVTVYHTCTCACAVRWSWRWLADSGWALAKTHDLERDWQHLVLGQELAKLLDSCVLAVDLGDLVIYPQPRALSQPARVHRSDLAVS
eukprot:scaffold26231_cov74-Phaeocystis_antarctica.AAC.1